MSILHSCLHCWHWLCVPKTCSWPMMSCLHCLHQLCPQGLRSYPWHVAQQVSSGFVLMIMDWPPRSWETVDTDRFLCDYLLGQPCPGQLSIYILSPTLCPCSSHAGQLCSRRLLQWLCHVDLWPGPSLFGPQRPRHLALPWSGPWWLCPDQTRLGKLSIPNGVKCIHIPLSK